MVFERVGAGGLAMISHSGSRSSRCKGPVPPTTSVMESVSDSKERMEVGVMESFWTCRFMAARGLRAGEAVVGFWTKRSWPAMLGVSWRVKA